MNPYQSFMKKSLWLVLIMLPFFAEAASPEGYWKSVDIETDQATSVVRITRVNNTLEGTVVRYLQSFGESSAPVCKKCPPPYKDQPIIGMKVLWGFSRERDAWVKGSLLVPKRGRILPCNLKLSDDDTLMLRVYPQALSSKTITWKRVR